MASSSNNAWVLAYSVVLASRAKIWFSRFAWVSRDEATSDSSLSFVATSSANCVCVYVCVYVCVCVCVHVRTHARVYVYVRELIHTKLEPCHGCSA